MTAALELPALCTVDDASKALALHSDQIRRLIRAGELVGYRLGRAVRVDAASVRDYAARCRLHVPQLVPAPTSAVPISTAEGRRGTPAGARSRAAGSPSGPPTAPRQSESSGGSSPTPSDPVLAIAEVRARLRARRRSRES